MEPVFCEEARMRLKQEKPVGSWKGRVTGPLLAQADRVDEILKENPTITLAELQAEVGGSKSGLSRMLRSRLEHKTYKQVRSMDLKEQRKARRKAWCQKMLFRLNFSGRLRQKLKPLKLGHINWSDEKLFQCRKTSKSGQNMRWRASGFGNKRFAAKAKPDAAITARTGQSPGSMAQRRELVAERPWPRTPPVRAPLLGAWPCNWIRASSAGRGLSL